MDDAQGKKKRKKIQVIGSCFDDACGHVKPGPELRNVNATATGVRSSWLFQAMVRCFPLLQHALLAWAMLVGGALQVRAG